VNAPGATTAVAHPNLALIKYWGNRDNNLNLPANNSISVILDGATTTTTVRFDPRLTADLVILNGQPADSATGDRVARHLDRIRTLAGTPWHAEITSTNDFPVAAGIASSASAYAALSLAATRALGMELDERELSILARKGSGSACRSLHGGFVEWLAGHDDDSSYAVQLAPPEAWDLCIVTAVLDTQPKLISSQAGHLAAAASPFFAARLAALPEKLAQVRAALEVRDLEQLGMLIEREAVELHTIAMTSQVEDQPWLSGIYYWQPTTIALIQKVQRWRRDGLPVYFTIDAGPNLHLFCEPATLPALELQLGSWLKEWEGRYFVSHPGPGAMIVS